jgi:multidrug efflux system outer membrane protein
VKSGLFPGGPTFDSLSIQASYILDFWGQYRRATEAAKANLVATQYGQDVVRTTLVSDIASAYFSLRQYDLQLDYSQKTLEADRQMLNLNTVKFKGGESAETDVLQAQLLVEQAEAQIVTLKQSIEQTENAVSILLGRNPGAITRGIGLTEQPHMPQVPAGLPSTLLERRDRRAPGGDAPGIGQCQCGSGQGRLLPPVRPYRPVRHAEHLHYQFPRRPGSVLGHRRAASAADL